MVANIRQQRKRKKTIANSKLLIILLVLLTVPLVAFGYGKYKDWNNAQFIKDLALDFPMLVEEIEQGTSLELEQESICFKTQEKFGEGVEVCEVSVGYVGLDSAEQSISINLFEKMGFLRESGNGGKTGYKLVYKNKNSCSLWFAASDRFAVTCITAVREANIDLAREVFLGE